MRSKGQRGQNDFLEEISSFPAMLKNHSPIKTQLPLDLVNVDIVIILIDFIILYAHKNYSVRDSL